MNKSQFYIKIACLAGYLLFASLSAYFTATSLSLNLMEGRNIWLFFVLVLIISILAGWCLTNVIAELKKTVNASRSSFVLNLLGFLIFWLFSFTTNVHYFFVEKHGLSILTKELTSAKQYIDANTSKANKNIEDQRNTAKQTLESSIGDAKRLFEAEIESTLEGRKGFGDICIKHLHTIEQILRQDANMYGDKNGYVIFEPNDEGDRGTTNSRAIINLLNKYNRKIETEKQKKLAVIDNFYDRQKDQNTELLDLLEPIETLETKHLPLVLKDGSATAFYKYQAQQDGRVLSKLPAAYKDYSKKEKVYPSGRMFDTMSVWKDMVSGGLGDMTMIQWIVIALICDLVAFILFALFRK